MCTYYSYHYSYITEELCLHDFCTILMRPLEDLEEMFNRYTQQLKDHEQIICGWLLQHSPVSKRLIDPCKELCKYRYE